MVDLDGILLTIFCLPVFIVASFVSSAKRKILRLGDSLFATHETRQLAN